MAKESIEDVATGPNVTDDQRTEFTDLARQFTNLFTEAPGTTDLVQHHIKLTSDKPVRSRPHRVPYSMRESLRKDIADMIKMGVSRESSSPYASPIVVVKKKDNTNRVCVDYRKLNKLYLILSLCQLLNTCSRSLVETNSFQKLTLAKDTGR